MVKFTFCLLLAFCVAGLLHTAAASKGKKGNKANQGFCYKKYKSKTGACIKIHSRGVEKEDCCSSGGLGWSKNRKGRHRCDPCLVTYEATSFWSVWSEWSNCNATCGPSVKIRTRNCTSTGQSTCKGKSIETKTCKTKPCPIDGGWSRWGKWTSCSKSCGKGHQSRGRTCTNPAPQHGGKDCQGLLEDSRPCEEKKHCPIDGGWGEWGHWSTCSLKCGLGQNTRTRLCNNPVPKYDGKPCNKTEGTEMGYCRIQRCEEENSGDYSGSGSGWESGSSGSGSFGSAEGWEEYSGKKARRDSDDEDS